MLSVAGTSPAGNLRYRARHLRPFDCTARREELRGWHLRGNRASLLDKDEAWYKNWSSRSSLCYDDASLMFPRVQAATELATFGVVQAATELAGEGGTDMVQSFLGLESNWLG